METFDSKNEWNSMNEAMQFWQQILDHPSVEGLLDSCGFPSLFGSDMCPSHRCFIAPFFAENLRAFFFSRIRHLEGFHWKPLLQVTDQISSETATDWMQHFAENYRCFLSSFWELLELWFCFFFVLQVLYTSMMIYKV